MRAITEVMDRTEGKVKQTMEGAVEKSQPGSPFRNMSRDELVEQIIETSVRLIRAGLEGLNKERCGGDVLQLRKAAPRLRQLQQGLTSLVETLAEGGVPSVL